MYLGKEAANFNHTNPLLNRETPHARKIIDEGYRIAEFQQLLKL